MKPSSSHSERPIIFQRKPIDLSQEPVKLGVLEPGAELPLVLEPGLAGTDLPGWLSSHLALIEQKLQQHGGVLMRGFGLRAQEDFQTVLDALRVPLMDYREGATPRTHLGARVYTSTEFPPEHRIALHNELSYVQTWPMKICFFCQVASTTGGETPIADVRKVYQRIPANIRQRFEEKGWRLVRNYGTGFGPTWQQSFHLQERAEVESYCRQSGVGFEWMEGDRLRTQHTRPAVRHHPVTGEPLWFNHVAFWHLSSLAPEIRAGLQASFKDGDYPYNTYYGDGTPIEDEVVEVLRQAYEAETVRFPWRPGDVLLLENMLVAHGRESYSGPRRILTAMGEPMSSPGVAS